MENNTEIEVVPIGLAKVLKILGFSEKTEHNYYTCNVTGLIKLEKSGNPSNWNDHSGKNASRKGRKWSAPYMDVFKEFVTKYNEEQENEQRL